MARKPEGIEVRHGATGTKYRPSVYLGFQEGRKTYRRGAWTADLAQAKAERLRLLNGVQEDRSPTSSLTLYDAATKYLNGIESGHIRNRSGQEFKPSVVISYRRSLYGYVLPVLGTRKLGAIQRRDLQALVDTLSGAHSASTVRNTLNPVRSIYRWALARDMVSVNPTLGLELPAVRPKKRTIVDPGTAAQMIAAVPERDRHVWALGFYAGLRLGEVGGLEWSDVDLTKGLIHVRRSYDWKSQATVTPKSKAGSRVVPLVEPLAVILRPLEAQGRVWTVRDIQGLYRRSSAAWEAKGLPNLTLHTARHTFASVAIAANVPMKRLSTYLGHSNINITLDLYTHLLEGDEEADAARLSAFLA